MTLNSNTTTAGAQALASQYNDLRRDVLEVGGEYGVAAGSGGAYALSIDAQITAYASGMSVKFEANHTASGDLTLNVNSIGATSISNISTVTSGRKYLAVYDGTDFTLFEEAVTSGLVLNAGADLTAGAIVSIDGNGEAVPVRRELPSIVNSLATSEGSGGTQKVQMYRVSPTQAIAHLNGSIDLVSVANNTMSIDTNVSYTGSVTSEYGGSICQLTDTLYAIVYINGTTATAAVVSVSGTTLTIEDTATIATGVSNNEYMTIARVSDSKFAVCTDNGTNVVIVGCEYSGGTITADTANQFTRSLSSTQQWVITLYDTDEIIFFWRTTPGDDVFRVKILFSGTVPTQEPGPTPQIGTNVAFLGVLSKNDVVGVSLSSTVHYSIPGSDVWNDTGNFSVFEAGWETGVNIGENKHLILRNYSDTSGSIRSVQSGCVLEWNQTKCLSIIYTPFNNATLGLVDFDNDVLANGITVSGGTADRYNLVYYEGNLGSLQGAAVSAATAGNAVEIATSGIQGGYSGLTVGSNYYLSFADLSTPTTVPSEIQIGTAVSPTEIALDVQRTNYIVQFAGDAPNNSRSINLHLFGLPQVYTSTGSFFNAGNTTDPQVYNANVLVTTANPGTLQTSPS